MCASATLIAPNNLQISVKAADHEDFTLKFETPKAKEACGVIAGKCRAMMEQKKKEDAEKAVEESKANVPQHIVHTQGGESSELELSPNSKKTSIFASNLFYYQRKKANEERWVARQQRQSNRACELLWCHTSPKKAPEEPRIATPKGSLQATKAGRHGFHLVGQRLEAAALSDNFSYNASPQAVAA